ncbi:mitochondrial carrier domain-containing protein [Ephemerocybe angulata]|uniref:Mitochondrial carrier domain-containing protein n=1 Tax=Ephemerocybe angulata TaxID=980116 RepID=A0A8H6IKZ0_9AGAR|nr:mitochondrial carrier domain-containing protein [Tulosesus angulatus]
MDPFQAKIIAAATGSTLTALTMTPFDLVKTRLQTQPRDSRPLFPKPPPNTCCQPSNAASCVRNMSSIARPLAGELVCVWDHGVFKRERVTGFYDAVKHVWKAEGVAGLWKGCGTSLVIGVPSSTAYILTYDHLLNNVLPPLLHGSALTPAHCWQLIRTNLQSTPVSAQHPHTLRSVLTSLRSLIRQNGTLYLWRGLGPTLWRDVTFSGYYWASYEAWKKAFANRGHEGAFFAFISGAISGSSAALLTSPFDVLKTRRQALIMSGSGNQLTGTISLLSKIIKTEGASALFAGLSPRVAKIAPACGIMISCYEGIGRWLIKSP